MPNLMIPEVRIGFAALYKPEAFAEGEPAFQGALIIPPAAKIVKLIDKTYLEAATIHPKWGAGSAEKAKKIIDACMKDRKKSAWQKQDYTNEAGDCYDGFEDMFYLRARNEDRPLVINQSREEVGRGGQGAPYGGCYVNAKVELWLQANSFGKALRCRLLGVQFVRDGDAFSGGSKASVDDFENLSVDQDEDENEFA